LGLKAIENLLSVSIYPVYFQQECINKEKRDMMRDEMRTLASLSLGSIPEYQCFEKKDTSFKDKLIVLHRNKEGRLDGMSSAVILCHDDHQVGNVMHLGVYVVRPDARHRNIQFKLGLASLAAFMACVPPEKRRCWITNLSSVLGTLAVVDKMFIDVFPGMKQKQPGEIHKLIADRFCQHLAETCSISERCVFNGNKFVYEGANKENCFMKASIDKRFHSLSHKHNAFYQEIADLNNGDEVLQIGWIDERRIYLGFLAYLYRVYLRRVFLKAK